MDKQDMAGKAERHSVAKTRGRPADCSAATKLWSGAKSATVAPCNAKGAQIRVAIPLPVVAKSRSRTESNSRAILLPVAHSGSGQIRSVLLPTAMLTNSFASAEAKSVAEAAAKAGHRNASEAEGTLGLSTMTNKINAKLTNK